MSYRRGTYAEGFAPRDFAPQHPNLWQSRELSFHPGLGNTGTTLRDWAGKKRDAILTGVSSTTVFWNADSSLGFGTTGRNSASLTYIPTLPFSVGIWLYLTSISATRVAWWVGIDGAFSWTAWYLAVGSDGSVSAVSAVTNSFASAASSASLVTTGKWFHLGAVFLSTTSRTVYLNGKAVGTDSTSSNPTSLTKMYLGQNGVLSAEVADWAPNYLDDFVLFTGALTESEFQVLATRRGISYEPRVRRLKGAAAATGNRRRRVLLMGTA